MTKHLLLLGSLGLLVSACTTPTAPQPAPRSAAPNARHRATVAGQQAAGGVDDPAASALPPDPEAPVAAADEPGDAVEPSAEVQSEASGEPVPREPIPTAVASLVSKRLYAWTGAWNQLIRGFAPKKFVLAEVAELPPEVAAPSLDDLESTWPYDVEFLRRHPRLFRPSPAGSLWADIYVKTFGLEGSEQPLQAQVGDTSYLVFLDPKTGASRIARVLGISCGFSDAFWRDRASFVAVGSCIDGEVQRPFVMHADLQRLVIELFDYPDGTSSRFDTEPYIRRRNPSIRF